MYILYIYIYLFVQSYFGHGCRFLGLVNNDLVEDIAVGAPFIDSQTGVVFIIFLDNSGSAVSHKKIGSGSGGFTGTLISNDKFGYSVAGIGGKPFPKYILFYFTLDSSYFYIRRVGM